VNSCGAVEERRFQLRVRVPESTRASAHRLREGAPFLASFAGSGACFLFHPYRYTIPFTAKLIGGTLFPLKLAVNPTPL
jgi:hypothetical protein